ncbi:putative leucine-rich repeat-containing protein DDB_G0290503 [Mytilus trossulus]|uniref:putative leucine-rich repeat-containing protein DDB_G0290503 n=1 Tax=Mytilus trossulus TaxID=6551 RepID=UPI003004DCE5
MSVVTHEAEMICKSKKLEIEKSFRNKLDEYENSIQQLTTDVNKIKNDFKTVKLDVNELRSSVKSESYRINQLSDTRAQGVVSLKTKTNIMSDKLKEFDDELKKVNIDCCSHTRSISDLRKRIINTEKDVKVLDKSTKSYADFLKSKSKQVTASAEALDNYNESDLSQSTKPIQRNTINEHSNSLVDSHTKHVRSSDVTNLSVLVKDIHVQSNVVNPAPSTSIENKIKNTNNNISGNEQNTNIQVHFPTSMCNPTTVDNFRGFVNKNKTPCIQILRRWYRQTHFM